MHGPSSRPMAWLTALVLSAALHAALVVALGGRARWPARAPPSRPGSTIIGVDVLGAPTGPGSKAASSPPPVPASLPPRPTGAPPTAPAPRPRGEAHREPPAARSPDATPEGTHDDPGTSLASAANERPPGERGAPSEVGEALGSREAPGGSTGAEGAEPRTLEVDAEPELAHRIHEQLARAAEHCYPSAARRFRQVGVVSVSFCVTATGGVRDVELRGSSGIALLDSATTRCVLPRAIPFPTRAAPRCFEVAVRFGK